MENKNILIREKRESSVGVVKTMYYTFNGIDLENGEHLGPITLA